MPEHKDRADFAPAMYQAQETLHDGATISIRAIRPDDKDRLREHGRRLSRESVYHRFMAYKRELTGEDLLRFTELDFDQQVAIAATLIEDGQERIIGVGRYVRTSDERAEVAFSVVDSHQGRGIGSILLAHLSRIARYRGITEFEADVMGDNTHMLDLIAASGFKMRETHESGIIHVSMRIDDAAKA